MSESSMDEYIGELTRKHFAKPRTIAVVELELLAVNMIDLDSTKYTRDTAEKMRPKKERALAELRIELAELKGKHERDD